MKGKKFGTNFLKTVIVAVLCSLPFTLRKQPIKDWIIVYLFNAVTNGFIDNILTSYNIVKYPVRLMPKLFKTSITFNFFVYPLITIIFNQWTSKDRIITIIYKLLIIASSILLIELWAEKKTSLIKWKKGWDWYHTFFSIMFKSLFTRMIIGGIRKVDELQESGLNKYE